MLLCSLQVCENDILLVDVVNRVPGQGFGIHWRGQHQKETPVMDGVPMVTQLEKYIKLNSQCILGVQLTDGIFGALIVRQSPRRDSQVKLYDVDDSSHVIVINEWSHGFAIQRLLEPNPGTSTATLLINGRSHLQESDTVPTPLSTFTVSPGKRYRFRVAYAGGGRGCPITIRVAGHVLRVIALDGNPIVPRERADFVLTADQPVASYWLRVSTAEDCDSSVIKGTAILRYEGADVTEAILPASSDLEPEASSLTLLNTVDGHCTVPEEKGGSVCLPDVKSLHKIHKDLTEGKTDKTLYLGFGFKPLSGESTSYPPHPGKVNRVMVPQLNNLTFTFPPSPLLTQAEDLAPDLMCRKEAPPPRCQGSPICECVHVIDLPLGATVELILVDQGGSDSGHVFHLHGYSFYVVGVRQMDEATPLHTIQDLDKRGVLLQRNLVNPVLKDTVTVPSNGYWLLHDQHVSYWTNGLDVVFHVGNSDDVPPPPKDFPRCGSFVGPEFFLI
ncbi:hypothetical protein C0J52_23401 [Blattella germanica]|nr:hypothetical protein C0J52_23401 [Blattella germanica]